MFCNIGPGGRKLLRELSQDRPRAIFTTLSRSVRFPGLRLEEKTLRKKISFRLRQRLNFVPIINALAYCVVVMIVPQHPEPV